MVAKINPDSVVLEQLDDHWQKLTALLLWKLVGAGQRVTITAADIEAMHQHFAPGIGVVLTHGHSDSLTFALIDVEEAQHLAAHDATQRGHA